jgi:hypothetical protein
MTPSNFLSHSLAYTLQHTSIQKAKNTKERTLSHTPHKNLASFFLKKGNKVALSLANSPWILTTILLLHRGQLLSH